MRSTSDQAAKSRSMTQSVNSDIMTHKRRPTEISLNLTLMEVPENTFAKNGLF